LMEYSHCYETAWTMPVFSQVHVGTRYAIQVWRVQSHRMLYLYMVCRQDYL
jgi:hypothetical protein